MSFSKQHTSFTVKQLLAWHKRGKLNLNPGFQRESVWKDKDRKALVDTLLRGMPLPNIFLWEHKEGNKVVYDVIDGKQRIESLLAFTRPRLPLTLLFDPEGESDWNDRERHEVSWKSLQRTEPSIYKKVLGYEFPAVIVEGDLAKVEQVFIRINSTGKSLTKQEIRHARWYQSSELLKTAESIAKTPQYHRYFQDMGILSESQMTRMKAVELITELMLTIEREAVLDRKRVLDSAVSNKDINRNTVARLARETKASLNLVKRLFPQLHTTRFCRSSDFYALFFAVWKMKRDGYQLGNTRNAEMAFHLLTQLDLQISQYRDQTNRGITARLQSPAREYLSTVREGTDTAIHRRKRVEIIEQILRPVFNRKDPKRLFSVEQKRLLWHSSKDKRCSAWGCKAELSWHDVRMDHIQAHTKGGRTDLKNAQILCASCNARKGAN